MASEATNKVVTVVVSKSGKQRHYVSAICKLLSSEVCAMPTVVND